MRLCKKHILQDSGASLKAKGPADKATTISRLYDELIEKKLAKARMEAAAEREADAAAEAHQVNYEQSFSPCLHCLLFSRGVVPARPASYLHCRLKLRVVHPNPRDTGGKACETPPR